MSRNDRLLVPFADDYCQDVTTDARRRAVRDLTADLDALVDGVVAEVVAKIPAYAALERTQLAEVGAIARWSLTRLLELWLSESRLDDADLRRFQGIGAVRAMDGRPLPAVLRAYRVAASYALATLVERHGDDLTVADVAAASSLWLETVDVLSEAIYAGYEGSVERIGGDGALALGDLLHDLLLARHSSPAALADRSRTLGITLPERPHLVVMRPRRATAEILTLDDVRAAAAELAPPAGGTPPLAVVRDRRGVVLAHDLSDGQVGEVVAPRGWVACVMRAHPLGDLATAYRLAGGCLDAAPDHAWDRGGVLGDGDAQTLALLTGSASVAPGDLAVTVLGELLQPGQEHLLEGLDALLAAGGAASAAATLGLHAQTLRYRARRIGEVTGRDPRHPWDRFVLQVARTAGGAVRAG